MRKVPTKRIDMICKRCGCITPIQRSTNKTPRLLTTEKSWCYKCKSYTEHYIIEDLDIIKNLLNNDNLSNEEEKIYKIFKSHNKL